MSIFKFKNQYLKNQAYIFSQYSKLGDELKKRTNIINRFMQNKKIPQDIQYNVRKYLDYYWREEFHNNIDVEMKLVNQLHKGLKEKLLVVANQNILKNCSFFKENFSESIIQKMLPLIKQAKFYPEQQIFQQNDLDECSMYFIEKGLVEICHYETNPLSKKQKYMNTFYQIQKGSTFGEMSFFTGQPRLFTVRSLEFSIVLVIQRSDFISLLKEYPNDFEKFCMIRDQLTMNQNYKQIGISCFSCNENSHVVGECPTLHYVPDKSNVIRKLSQDKKQIRLAKKRTNLKKQSRRFKDIQLVARNIKEKFQYIIDDYIIKYLYEQDEGYENDKEVPNIQQDKMFQDLHSFAEEQPSNYQSVSNFSNYINQNPPEQTVVQMNCSKYSINRNLDNKNDITKNNSKSNIDYYMVSQLLPKLPSTGSILEKQQKDQYRDSTSYYQEENQNMIYSIEPINNEIQQKRQNTSRQIQQNNPQFVSYQSLNQKQESFDEPSKKSNLHKKNQNNNDLQNIELGINDQNEATPKQNMISQFEDIKSNKKPKTITIKIPTPQIPINQIKQQQQSFLNSNSPTHYHIQQGKQSIIYTENTATKTLNRLSKQMKTNSFEDDNLIFSYFQKQLKDMRGLCGLNTQQIITESVKEYRVYFPEFNISRVIEKMRSDQKKKQKYKKSQDKKYSIQLLKKSSNHSLKQNQLFLQNDDQSPSSKLGNNIEDQKQQNQNFEQNLKKLTINIIKQNLGNLHDQSQKLIQSNINIPCTQDTHTEQAILANLDETKQFDTDTFKINTSLIQQQRCEQYCLSNGEQSFLYSNTDHL